MSRNRRQPSAGLALALVLLLLLAVPALARTSALFELPWWTVDGGGGVANGGAYNLAGTAGQTDAALASGGDYQLKGGYWTAAPAHLAYLPVVLRGAGAGLNSPTE